MAVSNYKNRVWNRQPGAERVLQELIADVLARSPQARLYGERLLQQSAVRLRDVIDHIDLPDQAHVELAESVGWSHSGEGVWRHPEGLFPALRRQQELALWLRVESIENFASAIGVSGSIEGKRHGVFRRAVAFTGDGVRVGVVERNGFAGHETPQESDQRIRSARIAFQQFRARRREFDEIEQGLTATERLVDAVIGDIGPHWACDLWLKAEREYWMQRCAAGRLQKQRQDAVGIGFANIDHHTYDGSRRHFRHTIRILEKLGYELREMLYAGELAGWGSQVLEQPAIGSTIFADVDLAPDELDIDFAHEPLPELPKHRRAGLVSALLGESILEAGLNHVACLFDQAMMRQQLGERGVSMMDPFTSFPHLYQELTVGEWAGVELARIQNLEAGGHISAEEAERLRLEGAVLSHLENIERNDGYKGFNREGIDSVLRKLDPRVQHLQQRDSA